MKTIFTTCLVLLFFNGIRAQMSFVYNGQSISSSNSWDIRLANLTGDSIPDAYFENKVWVNDGKGHFTKTSIGFGTGTYTSFADINGDGFVEAVCNDSIFLNDGKFNFGFSKKLVSNIVMYCPVLADIDNDGDIDIISCSETTDRILLNDGKGNFTNTGKSLGGWGQATYAFGDINGDGFTDIYVAIPHNPPPVYGHASNKIWFGDKDGNFTSKNHDIPVAESRGVILTDFNGDGKVDLFVSDRASWGRLFLNDGYGNYTDSGQKLGSHTVMSACADFDSDGDIDLFICQNDGNSNGPPFTQSVPAIIVLNDGKGHFTDSGLRLGTSSSMAAALGDINNDNRTDAIVVNVKINSSYATDTCPVEIWLNTKYTCNYLNEVKPGKAPKEFGSGTVSVNEKNTHALTFSPDGSTLIFSRYPEGKSYIMNYADSVWSNPAEAFFSGNEACFSPYGNKIFYYTDNEIYYNLKEENTWGSPIKAGGSINTTDMEYYPSVTYDGTLFFSRGEEWKDSKIMFSTLKNGSYSLATDIGLPVNTGGALHEFVAPDKSYMIFNSPRIGSNTQLDLWISFSNNHGTWTNPKNLGSEINSGADAILCPKVSPDGLYLFFTKLTYSTSAGLLYWVSTDFIDSLKHTNNVPYAKTKIADQVVDADHLFDFTLPTNTFIDDDGNNTLSYGANLTDGNPLPTWLSFNPSTLKFSGTPLKVETINIRVTATDTAMANVHGDFKIKVNASTAIETIKKSEEAIIYPNPTNGQFNIFFGTNLSRQSDITIYDLQGNLVFFETYYNTTVATIDLTGKPKGIYMVKFTNDGCWNKKLCLK